MRSSNLHVGSCDCHVHVFGDPVRFPPKPDSAYPPPTATWEDLARVHAAVGITRAVLVQPTAYGIDHRLLIESLRGSPQCRGVAIVSNAINERDLMALHDAGIRGARFSLGGPLGAMPRAELDRSVARIQELGWHAKFGGGARDLVAHRDWLRQYRGTAVLDHLAGADPADGMEGACAKLVLELLRHDNWWILLSSADRRSQASEGWDDMIPFMRAYAAAAPQRAIWGTDWPFLLYRKSPRPDISSLVGFLRRAIPDADTLSDILVSNPARLYGFTDTF